MKISACFHDVGKVGIPDDILLKPGKHDGNEWEIMKTHSAIGEDIVRRLELEDGDTVTKAIRHHHEYFNGEGYPDGLSGDQIPFMSKIISICDSYDAMTNGRPYHRAKTHDQVLEILVQEKGKKSDPSVFSVFQSIIGDSRYRSD